MNFGARSLQQDRRDSRVHTPGQAQDHSFAGCLFFERRRHRRGSVSLSNRALASGNAAGGMASNKAFVQYGRKKRSADLPAHLQRDSQVSSGRVDARAVHAVALVEQIVCREYYLP